MTKDEAKKAGAAAARACEHLSWIAYREAGSDVWFLHGAHTRLSALLEADETQRRMQEYVICTRYD